MKKKRATRGKSPKPKRKRPRSPAYPGINLEAALARAETLRNKQGTHWASADEVFFHWGLSANSSRGFVELSALIKFGLLESKGSGPSRSVRLSELGNSILLDQRPVSQERALAIQKAALTPQLHTELWKKYKYDWPDESHLDYRLRKDRGFTDSGAKDFIRQFKSTLTFAGLFASDIIETDGSDKTSAEGEGTMAPEAIAPPALTPPEVSPTATKAQVRTIQVPLSGSSWALLQAAFPMEDDDWDQMLAVLEAMKPGLVVERKKPGKK